jgi:hypothetical protein
MRKALVLLVAVLAGTASGCGASAPAAMHRGAEEAQAVAARPAPPPAPTPGSGCTAARAAKVSGAETPYAKHAAGLQLVRGRWASGDELVRAQKPCATGKLNGLGATATVSTLVWSTRGSTGRWWAIALCVPGKQPPACVVQDVLDDREPIKSVYLSDGQATVVYMTRTSHLPDAGIDGKRTAIYRYDGHGLTQSSYVDEPASRDD